MNTQEPSRLLNLKRIGEGLDDEADYELEVENEDIDEEE